jgi:hypothetical protein
MNRILFVVFFLTTCTAAVQSQNVQQQDTVSTKCSGILYSDGTDFVRCIELRFHEATHPDGESLVTAGIIAGTTGLLFFADQPVRSFAERNHSILNDDVLNITEKYGVTENAILLSGSIYGAGLIFGAPEIRKTGTMLLESLLWTGTITTILKCVSGRSRPYRNEGNTKFRWLQVTGDYLSFPSGHSAVAFTVSSVLSERIHNTAASIGLYSLAGLTAAARVYHDQHWVSDVFLGAVIGTSVGTSVAGSDETSPGHTSTHIYLIPNGIGFAMDF